MIASRMPARPGRRRPAALLSILAVLALVLLPLALAGCGQKAADDETVLAKVGDREITAGYYKSKLKKMQRNQLPRDEEGQVIDTSTLPGKEAFLDVLINKDLMVLKGLELGYDRDANIAAAKRQLTEYHAMTVFWVDEMGDPATFVSNEDLDYYYSRLGEKRDCDFIITDFEDQAWAAREAAQNGTPWEEIKKEYHSPYADPDRETRITIPWGQYRDDFERAVFGTEVGEVTEPIRTQYGYWILRVNGISHDEKPDLDAIKVRVLESIRQRNMNLAQEDLRAELRRKHNFEINDDVLMTAFLGLPEGETIIDETTGKPTPRDELKPLDVPSDQLDEILMSYNLAAGPQVYTLGDYKARFDEMNVFERPKKSELLGGFRARLIQDAGKTILVDEARSRGYFEDPRTIERASEQVEEMIVEKVHSDVIDYEQYVSPEAIEAFWQEHKEEYFVPETRHGFMASCKDRETALLAREAVLEGKTWKQVNKMYGNDPVVEERFGRLHAVRATEEGPAKDVLFSLDAGELSQPIETPTGWVIVRCDRIEDAFQPKMEDRVDAIGQRIRAVRQDEALNDALAKWRDQYGVTVYPEALAEMPSQEELNALDPDLKPIEQNAAQEA